MSTPQTYKGNGHHNWEHVSATTWRLRVPGGWIYSTGQGETPAMAFVPMPAVVKHEV